MLKIVILIISIISLLNAVEGQSKPNYVNLCDFQNIGSAARHQCQGVTEIRIQEQSSQNENFWCFLLDNRNGQYTNQILKFGFIGGMNQMAQYSSKVKVPAGVLKMAFFKNRNNGNPVVINSLSMNGRDLCGGGGGGGTVGTVTSGPPTPFGPFTPTREQSTFLQQVITCGTQPALASRELISAGVRVLNGEYPWHAGLYKLERAGIASYFCGGSLINQNTIITAAHCLTESTGTTSADRVLVKLGTVDVNILGQYGRDFNVNQVQLHPNNINNQHDIALLRLRTTVDYTSYILPICYSKDTFNYVNAAGQVPGWGLTQDQRRGVSTLLNVATMPGKSEDVCKADNPEFFNQYLNTDYQLCAGNLNGTSVCNGDSGGGLVFKVNNEWVLRGIVSTSPGLKTTSDTESQCDLIQYVVFTDVAKHYDWIQHTLNSFR